VYALFALILSYGGSGGGRTNGRLHLRNVYLLFVSWFFYYKTSGLFLLILAFVTLSDWIIAQRIRNFQITNYEKIVPLGKELRISKFRLPVAQLLLALSVIIDLGLLAYFKYAYFFTNLVNDLFGTGFKVFDVFYEFIHNIIYVEQLHLMGSPARRQSMLRVRFLHGTEALR
jgi:hypothetical protein